MHNGARQSDAAYGQEVVEGKVQTDAEHQEHHADLSELVREIDIGDEARRGGTNDDARDQIAHQRGQLETSGDEAQDQGEP